MHLYLATVPFKESVGIDDAPPTLAHLHSINKDDGLCRGVMHIIKQLFDKLMILHEYGIIHLDLKLTNLVFDVDQSNPRGLKVNFVLFNLLYYINVLFY